MIRIQWMQRHDPGGPFLESVEERFTIAAGHDTPVHGRRMPFTVTDSWPAMHSPGFAHCTSIAACKKWANARLVANRSSLVGTPFAVSSELDSE